MTYAPKEECHFSHFDNSTVIPKETNEVLIPRDFHFEKAPINKYPSCPAIRSDLIPHPQFPGVKTTELYDIRALQSLKKETTDLPYSPLSAREVENNSIPDRCEQKQALQIYTGGITPSWTETLDRINNYSKLSDPFGTCAARVTRASQSFSLVYVTVVASSLVTAALTAIACIKSQAVSISSHTYVFTTPKKKRSLPTSNQKRPPLPKTSIKNQIISDF